MLESSIGALTIVDINLPTMQAFWKGHRIENILSITSMFNPPALQKVIIRVISPAKIIPAISDAAQIALTDIYDEMRLANINIIKVEK